MLITFVLSKLTNGLKEKKGDELSEIQGICFDKENILSKIHPEKYFKEGSTLLNFFNDVIKPFKNVLEKYNPSGCIGDFSLDKLMQDQRAQKAQCKNFPLPDNQKMYSIALNSENVQCGEKALSINFCSVLNKSGNFVLSTTGEAISCLASATGIGALLFPISLNASSVQFGYSPDRKWSTKMNFLNTDEKKPELKENILNSHIYFGGNMNLPDFPIKIGEKNLKEIISGKMKGTFYVDFGKSNPYSLESMRELFSKTDKSNAMEKIKSLLVPAKEVSFSAMTTLKLNLKDLTHNFINELPLNDVKLMMMVSLSNNEGSTNLPKGFYMTFSPPPDMINDFLKPFLDKITENFIRFKFHLKFPSLKNSQMSLYLGDKLIQIKVQIRKISLTCSIRFKKFKIRCKTGGKILQFIKEAGKIIAHKMDDSQE
jgi:hypothetical protein